MALLLALFLFSCSENKSTINVAVASNFEPTLNQIVEKFHQQNGNDIKINIIAASSGLLSNQIINNAPFDLFLSADIEKPQLLEKQLNIKNKPSVYAIGQLQLWIPESKLDIECLMQLNSIKTLAIANPQTAPYGMLAVNILNESNIQMEKTIQTGNVSQAYLYTKDGLTQAGFVAKSHMQKENSGCIQTFDNKALSQSMLLLTDAAKELYQFILSNEIQKFIQQSGYLILDSNIVE